MSLKKSEKIDTSGPAFPSKRRIYRHGYPTDEFEPVNGMTLRDYFAANAPITYQEAIEWLDTYGGEVVGPWNPDRVMECLAVLRLAYADAMLKAREA